MVPRALIVRCAAATVCFGLLTPSSFADHGVTVSVTVTRIVNTGGAFNCHDGWPVERGPTGCSKPDFFVMISFEQPDGTFITCRPTAPVADIDTVSGSIPVACPGPIEAPFTMHVELWDDDEHVATISPPTFADQIDLDTATPSRTALVLSSRLGSAPATFTFVGSNATLTLTAAATLRASTITSLSIATTGPAVTPPAFDPQIGERAFIKGNVNDRTRITLTGAPSGGGAAFPIANFPTPGPFNIDWDGRSGNTILPAGIYTITARTSGGSTRTANVRLTARPPAQLFFRRLEPVRMCGLAPCWGFGAGALDVQYLTSSPGRVGLEVRGRADGGTGSAFTCSASVPVVRSVTPIATPVSGGDGQISWDGRANDGTPVTTGAYCLRLVGTAATGQAWAAAASSVLIVEDEPLRLALRTQPAVPALSVGRPVTVLARALNQAGQPRFADTITLSAGVFVAPGTNPLPTVFATCRRATTCEAPLPAGISVATTISFSTSASDVGGARAVSIPSRLIDLLPPTGRVPIRVNTSTTASAATIGQTPSRRTLDLALFPGTGFDLSTTLGTALFDAEIAATIELFQGVRSTSTSVTENIGQFSFWVSPSPATVWNTGGPGNGECAWSLPRLSFPESQGVLHRVNCRDSAWPASGEFSSVEERGLVAWHEFHHSGYDLADEYCCDGGYHEGNPGNVYRSAASCAANSVQASSCRPIRCTCPPPPAPCTRCPSGVAEDTGWWRSDPDPDVMNARGSRPEQGDDTRAALRKFNECRAGRC